MLSFLVIFYTFSILGLVFWVVSWPFRKKNMGHLLLRVKRNYIKSFSFWLGIFNAVVAIYLTYLFVVRLNSGLPTQTSLTLEIIQFVSVWFIAVLLLTSELNFPEFRENGICFGFTFVRWQSINSYHWGRKNPQKNFYTLTILFQRRLTWLPGMMMIPIPVNYQDTVNEILSDRLASKNV